MADGEGMLFQQNLAEKERATVLQTLPASIFPWRRCVLRSAIIGNFLKGGIFATFLRAAAVHTASFERGVQQLHLRLSAHTMLILRCFRKGAQTFFRHFAKMAKYTKELS